MKAALVVCWETKRAFDHLGARHFPMPSLKRDYQEMFSYQSHMWLTQPEPPSHIRLSFIHWELHGSLCYALL